MRLDLPVGLVVDGSDGEVVLEFLEGLLDFRERDVEPPEVFGFLGRQVGPQQVRALAPADGPEFRAVQPEGERRGCCRQTHVHDAGCGAPRLVPCHGDLPQQRVAVEVFHLRDLPEPPDQDLELPATHGLLLVAAAAAAGQDVGVAVRARRSLHLDALPGLPPGLAGDLPLELREPPARCPHEIARLRLAHLAENLLGGDAAVHDPCPSGLAVHLLDLREEVLQRGLVGRAAGHRLVGDGEPVGGHDERDDDLDAVGTPVAAVAEAAEPGRPGDVALEVGARQVVQQDVAFRAEQRPPAFAEVLEELVLVFAELGETAVERVLRSHALVAPEEVGHSRVAEPFAVHPPFAPGVEEPVGHDRRKHVGPAGPLAAVRQEPRPERLQPQQPPELQRQPAAAPLARTVQGHRVETHAYGVHRLCGRGAVLREQAHLAYTRAPSVNHFDRGTPLGPLGIIDLSEVEDLPRADAVARPHAFGDTPVAVLLAVLESLVAFEVHAPHYRKAFGRPQGGRSVLQRLLDVHPLKTLVFFNFLASKKSKMPSNGERRVINRIHSKKTKNHALLHVANLCFEEPDAVVPHVRVCGDASR